MNAFLEQISTNLTPLEQAVLSQANPLDADELQSLVETYPELATIDVRIPHLSNLAVQMAAQHGVQLSSRANPGQDDFIPALGALQPNVGARHSIGLTLAVPSLGAPPPAAAAPSFSAVDMRMPNWPVRDQNPRGTCVAFAATACREISLSQATDLSEQFLYWAIKDHHDGDPTADGTWLNFVRDALAHDGICTEALCPYSRVPIPPGPGSFQGGASPSPQAVSDAVSRTTVTTHYSGGTAAAIHASIASDTPTAVSLPVFGSPANPNQHNWNSSVGLSRGVVLNPPATATVVGGHAVCITGFVPNPAEPNGGHFVIRNSWGTGWGASGNRSDPRNPEPGYGSVSATYVERYAWEWLHV